MISSSVSTPDSMITFTIFRIIMNRGDQAVSFLLRASSMNRFSHRRDDSPQCRAHRHPSSIACSTSASLAMQNRIPKRKSNHCCHFYFAAFRNSLRRFYKWGGTQTAANLYSTASSQSFFTSSKNRSRLQNRVIDV